MLLKEIFADPRTLTVSGEIAQWGETEIRALTLDSRTVKPGSMFFCIDGYEQDGHKYAGNAADAGAAAIVCTKEVPHKPGVVYLLVEDMNKEINRIADLFYGRPSHKMTMFGATGTNGKSTVTSMISDIYSHFKPCGYMGTIAIRYGEYSRVPNLTTPDQIETHANLQEMLEHGMEACAMEVSSQGLDRGRVDSVDFDCALFTNLTHDHLDYHKTMENYFDCKKRLFRNLRPDSIAVLNADDVRSIEGLKECCPCHWVTYGTDLGETEVDDEGYPIEGSHSKPGSKDTVDYFATDIRQSRSGSSFILWHAGYRYEVETNAAALYNVYNLLAAMAAMHEMGMPIEDMLPWVKEIPQVDGRMDRIDEGQDFTVIVDYAHTPDGYEKIFSYAKEVTKSEGGRILATFGCPGKRDTVKRPVMGRIAGEYADEIILTSQDPRGEDPEKIAGEIAAGIDETGTPHRFIKDREAAIQALVDMAEPGDVILSLGKGGESYMYHEEGRRPWMTDQEAARKALRKRLGK